MDFKNIVLSRYATKKFDGKRIDQKKIDELFEIIRHAPSSFNLQPWKIKVITDLELRKKLQEASWGQEQVISCSHLLVFCADSNIAGLINRLEALLKHSGMPEQSLKGYVQMMRDFESGLTEEQRLAWSQRQTYLALENALLGAKALGFDSCPMEGFEPEKYAGILGLAKNIVPTALCAVGFAADKPHPKVRFAKEDVFF